MDQKPDLNRLVQLAQTDAGQQLLAILSRSDSGQLSVAMEQASQGNFTAAQKLLSKTLSTPEAQALIRKLGGQL